MGDELIRAHGYDGDPAKFTSWLEERTRKDMERLGFRTDAEYGAYLQGVRDGREKAQTERRWELRIGALGVGGVRWVVFLALCALGLIVAAVVLWGYFAFWEATNPWGWLSLLLVPAVPAGYLMWTGRRG